MTIRKRGYRIFVLLLVIAGMGLGYVPCTHASAQMNADDVPLPQPVCYTAEELTQRIRDTYQNAKAAVGYRSFGGRCSSMVNGSVIALGLHDARNRGDGRDIYDRYKDLGRSSSGYDVVCYDSVEYDLEEALHAVSRNGARDVFNLIVGWESGITASSSAYGHACFVHGIVDGKVYFSESFSVEINREYYSEGEPIVCTIEEFAGFYNKWAYFEGLIHFEEPDDAAPVLTMPIVRRISRDGFTLSVRAVDNTGVAELWALVWHEGQSEDTAEVIPLSTEQDTAELTVERDAFGGFDGRYYVKIRAVDWRGNGSWVCVSGDELNLYLPEPVSGLYCVIREESGVHHAPYAQVCGNRTLVETLNQGMPVSVTGTYRNRDGELWYQLENGTWMNSENLATPEELFGRWDVVWELFAGMLL